MPGYTPNKPSIEWYTPNYILDKARAVLGHIDLDPASCEYAQEKVQARMYFDKERDGLSLQWRGRVWLNPPYGRGIRHWVDKLIEEYQAGNIEAGICIVNNATDVAWFQPLWNYDLCFPTGRVYFEAPNREADSPAQGSIIAYLGKNHGRFSEHFSDLGPVLEFAGEGLRKFRRRPITNV